MQTLVAPPVLTVVDLGRAQRFYTKMLGFQVTAGAADHVVLSAPHLSCDLILQSAGNGPNVPAHLPHGRLRLPVATRAALADACDTLARSGARVMIIERSQCLSVHTTDPDGHAIELFTEGDPAVTHPARRRALTLDDLRAHA